jgi:hypothetical protein
VTGVLSCALPIFAVTFMTAVTAIPAVTIDAD